MTNRDNRWETLLPNDVIDIVAPASAAPLSKVEPGLQWLRQQGLIPHCSDKFIQVDLFFAGTLAEQWEEFEQALHSDAKVIWCLRGGYGSMRLIPLLEKMKKPKKPKLLIGFSDITALHLYLNQKWNWPTLHGRTISQLHPDWEKNQEQQDLIDLLYGRIDRVAYHHLVPLNDAAKKPQTIVSSLTGGNLRLIQTSLGTAWEASVKNKMLFIEDVSERGYSVDRMLEQLYQAKIMDENLQALLVGDFTEGYEKDGRNLVPDAIERFAQRVNYPVLKGLPCGHAHGSNAPLPFNTKAELTLGEHPSLVCLVNH